MFAPRPGVGCTSVWHISCGCSSVTIEDVDIGEDNVRKQQTAGDMSAGELKYVSYWFVAVKLTFSTVCGILKQCRLSNDATEQTELNEISVSILLI